MSEKVWVPVAQQRVARYQGFTLVEMLVTMALTAMIAGVLWQAMNQITRIERLLQGSGVSGQLELVRREWIRGLIQSALVEQIGAPRQFVGDAFQLSLISSESVATPGLAGRRLQLRVESDAVTRRQRLLIETGSLEMTTTSAEPAAIELLSWTGPEGRIRYLNADGVWLDHWPPAKTSPVPTGDPDMDFRREAQAALPRLPRAIWLDLGDELGGALVAQISTTQAGRGRLAQWEQQ